MATLARGHAKINLSLDIGGVVSSGLHAVRTVFQPLELGVSISVCAGTNIAFAWSEGPRREGVVRSAERAVEALCARARLSPARLGLAITIADHLRIAGGVGASSVVIGPVLRAVNDFMGLGYDLDALEQLAGELAGDGAFGVRCRSCLAEGHGEMLTPLRARPTTGVVIVEPALAYLGPEKTGAAYALFDASGLQPRATTDALLAVVDTASWRELAPWLGNAFEPCLLPRFPALARAIERLKQLGCYAAHVAGSGPCVYGLCDLGDETLIAEQMRASDRVARAVATRTMNL